MSYVYLGEWNKLLLKHPQLGIMETDNSETNLIMAFTAISFDLGMSQCQFAKKYNINRGNFSRWLKHKHVSQRSMDAVNELIKEVLMNNFEIYGCSVVQEHMVRVWRKEVLNLVGNDSKLQIINFIDADNINFKDFMDLPGLTIYFCNHVAFCKIMKYDIPNSNTHYIYKTLTGCKDAADIALSMEISIFNEIMDQNVEFNIITKDMFAKEALARIIKSGRKCAWIK
jgi:hypothetical protein